MKTFLIAVSVLFSVAASAKSNGLENVKPDVIYAFSPTYCGQKFTAHPQDNILEIEMMNNPLSGMSCGHLKITIKCTDESCVGAMAGWSNGYQVYSISPSGSITAAIMENCIPNGDGSFGGCQNPDSNLPIQYWTPTKFTSEQPGTLFFGVSLNTYEEAVKSAMISCHDEYPHCEIDDSLKYVSKYKPYWYQAYVRGSK